MHGPERSRHRWREQLVPFQKSETRKSTWQIINTVVPFLGLWTLAYLSLSISLWLGIGIAIMASGFFIRLFIIFHDCGHHSFFANRRANEIVGIITGALTFFPYHQWKREHAVHHATSGDLGRRGTGDMWTLTVNEYKQLSFFKRMVYRVYRNPVIMFGFGPIHLFFKYRFNRKGAGRKERVNTHVTTFTFIAILTGLCFILGWKDVLFVEGPILYVAGVVGIWLFYVQHQFEHTYFEKPENWDFVSAALQGSSFYELPRALQWLTGNIGYHHVHHLSPKVPNYHLQQVHESSDLFRDVPSMTLASSLRALRYRLWDEDSHRFIGFNEIMIESRGRTGLFRRPLHPTSLVRMLFKKSKVKP